MSNDSHVKNSSEEHNMKSHSKDKTSGAETENIARTAGRGFLIITAAKVWFLVTSTILNLGLPRFFGSADVYGTYGVVINSVSLLNMVMITGTLQAVAKLVSERPGAARGILKNSLRLQCVIGVPIAALFALGAPWISGLFHDDNYTNYLRLASLIILAYSFYAIYVGYFNGLKLFVRQATLDITYSTMKLCFIVGAVLLGFGVMGAVGGFVLAAMLVLMFAMVWVTRHSRELPEQKLKLTRRLLTYMLLVMAFTFALNGIMRVDLFILKSLSSSKLLEAGMGREAVNIFSDSLAGVYTLMLNVSRIPYQAVMAITFVVFPLVSKSTFDDDVESTRSYIRQTMRYALIMIAGLGILLAANGFDILLILAPAEYLVGFPALFVLGLGTIGFAVFFIATTVIIGSGHPWVSFGIGVITLVLSTLLNYLFQNQVKPGPDMLFAAGLASAIAMISGGVIAGVYLFRKFGAFVPMLTLLKVLIATAMVAAVTPWLGIGEYISQGKVIFLGILVAKMVILALVFFLVLLGLKEFDRSDSERLINVIRKNRS